MQTYRLRAPVAPEQTIHEAVADMLRFAMLPPVMWSCFPVGLVQLPRHAVAKLSRSGVQAGWPDFLIVYGGVYGLELKREGGLLTTEKITRTKRGTIRVRAGQDETFPKLLRAGFVDIAVCDSTTSVERALRAWQIPMRRLS